MTKTITLNSGDKAEVNTGDVIFVSLLADNTNFLVRGRYIDSKDSLVTISILNPKLELESVSIAESRVVKVEKPN